MVFGVGDEQRAGDVRGVVVEAGLFGGSGGEGGFGGHHLMGGVSGLGRRGMGGARDGLTSVWSLM